MRWMVMAACASVLATRAAAQAVPADSAACDGNGALNPATADTAAPAMITIDARFTAESIRLNAPASARVVLPACGPRGGVTVQRQNLPDRLEPGTTYRNGGIRILIQADAVLACRLAAALSAPAESAAAAGVDETICGAAPPSSAPAAAGSPGTRPASAPGTGSAPVSGTVSAPATGTASTAATGTTSTPAPPPARP